MSGRESLWEARVEGLEAALRNIAEFPEPLNNKGAALSQCAWLKSLAASAIVDSNFGSGDD